MTRYSDIWRLPGPNGFVREISRLAAGGQHVLAVLPEYVASSAEHCDALAAAVVNESADHQRVYPTSSEGSLTASLGFCMTDEYYFAPVTVADLLTHVDVVGRVFVCNSDDLSDQHRAELPSFLKRLDDESRSISSYGRGTMIFLLGRKYLGVDPASVATVRSWYWDRVRRWDVASFLSRRGGVGAFSGVIGEVRLETIIEVGRWDFELSLDLASNWGGSASQLQEMLSEYVSGVAIPKFKPVMGAQPPDSHLHAWDQGLIESWHGVPTARSASGPEAASELKRHMWSAQSRVLMPWIEVRRHQVEDIVRSKLGPERMAAAVHQYSTQFPGVDEQSVVVELSTLSRIIGARLGISENGLLETTRLLLAARNALAHLRVLSFTEVELLVQGCDWLVRRSA